MSDTEAGSVLAAEINAGPGGFVVVVLLAIAAVALFFFMSGSLRRMRTNVESGQFGASSRKKARGRPTEPSADSEGTDPAGADTEGAKATGGGKDARPAAAEESGRAQVPAQSKPGGDE